MSLKEDDNVDMMRLSYRLVNVCLIDLDSLTIFDKGPSSCNYCSSAFNHLFDGITLPVEMNDHYVEGEFSYEINISKRSTHDVSTIMTSA
jgi:hypothetical protein